MLQSNYTKSEGMGEEIHWVFSRNNSKLTDQEKVQQNFCKAYEQYHLWEDNAECQQAARCQISFEREEGRELL